MPRLNCGVWKRPGTDSDSELTFTPPAFSIVAAAISFAPSSVMPGMPMNFSAIDFTMLLYIAD